MGSFIGHVFPGTFFVLFGLWWTHCIFRRWYRLRPESSFHSPPVFVVLEGNVKVGDLMNFRGP